MPVCGKFSTYNECCGTYTFILIYLAKFIGAIIAITFGANCISDNSGCVTTTKELSAGLIGCGVTVLANMLISLSIYVILFVMQEVANKGKRYLAINVAIKLLMILIFVIAGASVDDDITSSGLYGCATGFAISSIISLIISLIIFFIISSSSISSIIIFIVVSNITFVISYTITLIIILFFKE